jgi:hypothetical protein
MTVTDAECDAMAERCAIVVNNLVDNWIEIFKERAA